MKEKHLKGFIIMRGEITRRTDLNSTDKILFGYLEGRTKKMREIGTDYWDAYMSKIAHDTGMSTRSVERSTERLVERGLIHRHLVPNTHNQYEHYTYAVDIQQAKGQWENIEYLDKLNKGRQAEPAEIENEYEPEPDLPPDDYFPPTNCRRGRRHCVCCPAVKVCAGQTPLCVPLVRML